jgi:hypothetical protein
MPDAKRTRAFFQLNKVLFLLNEARLRAAPVSLSRACGRGDAEVGVLVAISMGDGATSSFNVGRLRIA